MLLIHFIDSKLENINEIIEKKIQIEIIFVIFSLFYFFVLYKLPFNYYIFVAFQRHLVSRTQQGRQRESSVMTVRSPFSAELWRHFLLSGGSQRRALPLHDSEENRRNKYLISSSGNRTHNLPRLQSLCAPKPWPDWPLIIFIYIFYFYNAIF